MVCTCTKFIKGKVLKDKTEESVMNEIMDAWCYNFGYPTIGLLMTIEESSGTKNWQNL